MPYVEEYGFGPAQVPVAALGDAPSPGAAGMPACVRPLPSWATRISDSITSMTSRRSLLLIISMLMFWMWAW